MGLNYSAHAVFFAQTAITYLSQTGVLGKTNKEVSNQYFSLVTPAGYAFSIWGIIFSWETVLVLKQLFGTPTMSPTLLKYWLAANALQGLWSFTFAAELIIPSAMILAGVAGSLAGCIGCAGDQSFWLVRAPISLHAGWVTVAALLNMNLILVGSDANLTVQTVSAVGTIIAATSSGLWMLLAKRDIPFAFSIAWALLGVSVAQLNQKLIPISYSTKNGISTLVIKSVRT